FMVSDRGPGIPPEAQDRIFDRFFRGPGQNDGGMGIGLSVSREILTAHRGRIGFTSDAGMPTTFYFDLPLA
ncbi:MAG: sensor histidine kinase, partial [Akkermansiaceae bacterium]|nr:sensor histidine kinase [Akkermansiaceae bacterium]